MITNGVGVLVSKRNAKAKLIFPAQGTLFANPNSTYSIVSYRGSRARVWSSYSSNLATPADARVGHFNIQFENDPPTLSFFVRDPASNNTSLGLPIRCIAIDSSRPQ